MFGPWQDSIEKAFGVKRTSGDRSNKKQADLYRAGKTKVPPGKSAHNIPDSAIDIPAIMSADDANRRAAAAGIPVRFIYESGQGAGQGTGKHLHGQRILTSGRNQMASKPTETRGREAFVQSITAAIEGEEIPGVDDGDFDSTEHPLINPFTIGPEMKEKAEKVDQQIKGQEAFLSRQEGTMEEVQARRRARQELIVAEKRGLLDAVQQGNRELLANVNPLLQRQAAVSDRLARLATMNPLEKGIRGIFDLNFNDKYLSKVNSDLQSAIQDQGQRYQFVTTLQEQFMNQIDAENQNEGSLEELTMTELDEDGKMAAQGLNAAMVAFDFLGKEISADTEVVRAQILARSSYLDQLDAGQTASLLEQAQKSPDGFVETNGIRISRGELKQRSMQWEQTDIQLRNAQLSLQANEIELADKNARRLASTMTEAQLQEAARNNGQWNGITIPSDAVTSGLHGYAQRRELQTMQAMQQGGARQGATQLGQTYQYMRGTYDRVKTAGTPSHEFNRQIAANAQRLEFLSKKLIKANRQGLGDTVGVQLSQEIALLTERHDKALSDLAGRLAGNSELGKRLMTAYFKGEPINSTESASMMIEFVEQGGLPSAMRSSPTFRTMYQVTEKAVAAVDQGIKRGNIKVSEAERKRRITQEVNRQAPGKVNSANMSQLFPRLTQIAEGMKHPFAGVSRDDLLRAQQQGNAEGFSVIGRKIGLSPEDARKVFSGTWQKPEGMEASDAQKLLKSAEALRGELLVTQRASFLHALDESPSAKPGFRPSKALVDLISSPKFYDRVSQFQDMQRNFSFGDALSSSMGNGNLVETVNDYAQSMQSISNQSDIQRLGSSRQTRNAYNLIPLVRTKAILGAIDGLEQADEQLLLGAMKRQMPELTNTTMPNVVGVNQSIRGFILGNKFKDPNLERVRKIAAANYDATAKAMDRGIDRMTLEDEMPIGGPIIANLMYGKE